MIAGMDCRSLKLSPLSFPIGTAFPAPPARGRPMSLRGRRDEAIQPRGFNVRRSGLLRSARNDRKGDSMPDLPIPVYWSIPAFIGLLLLELWVARRQQRRLHKGRDTAVSLG